MIYGKKVMAGRKTRKKRRKARQVKTLDGLPADEWKRYVFGDLQHIPLEQAPIQVGSEAFRWIWLGKGADLFGYWRTCPFPICRRHSHCLAEYWPKGEPTKAHVMRPPCCHGDEAMYQRLLTWMHEAAAARAAAGK